MLEGRLGASLGRKASGVTLRSLGCILQADAEPMKGFISRGVTLPDCRTPCGTCRERMEGGSRLGAPEIVITVADSAEGWHDISTDVSFAQCFI